uniref:Uncharacterized protein n=1 Tax=Eutreptiella gymnastica TaxID=73025 RepID=A0A7S1I5T8_9EUGL
MLCRPWVHSACLWPIHTPHTRTCMCTVAVPHQSTSRSRFQPIVVGGHRGRHRKEVESRPLLGCDLHDRVSLLVLPSPLEVTAVPSPASSPEPSSQPHLTD